MVAASFTARGRRTLDRKQGQGRALRRRCITRSKPGATGSGSESEELGSPAGHAGPLVHTKKLYLAQNSVKWALRISNCRQMQPGAETLRSGEC